MFRNWRVAALLLAVVAVGAALWGVNQMQARQEVEGELAARYQQAFFEAVDHVENVEVLLSKGLAVSSPGQLGRVFADVRDQALAAQANLTQLPLLQGTLIRTSKFLTQVGDFGFTMNKKATQGIFPDEEDTNLVRRMRAEAALLSATLHEIQQEAAHGRMPWEEIRRRANRELRQESKDLDRTGFTRLEKHFGEIPVIQYDGPFSDHVLQKQPRGLTGEKVSESRAEEIALEFAPIGDKSTFVSTAIRRVEGGDIPAYGIAVKRQDSETADIVMDVSVEGGHVVWMLNKRDVGQGDVSMAEATEKARQFLTGRGFGKMVATFATEAENRAVIPFVPEVGGVLIYPDLVKVTVALDNGRIVGFESLGYLMSHTDRDLPRPEISAETARQRLSPELQATGEPRLALIPLETLEEVLTWEIPARMDREVFLTYINAETGAEERILRLVRTGEGNTTL